MDCFTCKFRGSVPGSAHSSCTALRAHSKKLSLTESEVSKLEMGFTVGAIIFESKDNPPIRFNPHGVKNGWASWPLNFDPAWLELCHFYQEKV